MNVEIRHGSVDDVLDLMSGIPEMDAPPPVEQWNVRLTTRPLLLIASADGHDAGFKVGYDRWQDGKTYYSWLGGVQPEYRRAGVATALQSTMEQWCIEAGYELLRFKTRNRYRNMIIFAMKQGFYLIDFEKKGGIEDHRLLFEKVLGNRK